MTPFSCIIRGGQNRCQLPRNPPTRLMCGINGLFAYAHSASPPREDELLRTSEHMALRGPDGKGAWFSPDRRVALAHRRLSIIDLSESGSQPMTSADGRLAITYNGEIYNFRAL